MSQNYCHHLTAAGTFCRGIPLKKRDYCYWHLHERGRRMKAARTRAERERIIIQLPVLDDLHAVQVSLMQLGEAILHDEIDERRGRLLLAVLRLAASNLKAQPDWLPGEHMQDCDEVPELAENPGFEKQYDLPKGFDLSVAPDVAFPPPEPGGPDIPAFGICGSDEDDLRLRFGQILRDAITPIPGVDFETTADDMDLMEVYELHGKQAGLERAAVLERNRKRRESRERRMRFEGLARNRNIQLAAEKLLLDQQRKVGKESENLAETQTSRKPPRSDSTTTVAKSAAGGA